MDIDPDCTEALVELGFTALEARIYGCLLRSSPATGYKVAKEIGATNASTYKALESLAQKGAILVDDARNRLCRAVPYVELFDQMERRFQERRRRASDRLRRLRATADDDRIYQLATVDQVYGRCRSMLAAAERIVLADVFPSPLRAIGPALEETADRGAKVIVQAYGPTELRGVDVILRPRRDAVLERWPVRWLALFSDGRQSLLAALEPDGSRVHQALWTASPVLSYALLSYADSELQLSRLAPVLDSAESVAAVRRARGAWPGLPAIRDVPGYRILRERFGGAVAAPLEERP